MSLALQVLALSLHGLWTLL